ncbi:MAG: MBL fold metallo-hydrolase [Phycisphaerales bacterium]|nr:MBL fold metallo-hydrolase [Phycisphaerales bacterium]
MLPKPPPREMSLGFLYCPPFRIIGESIAGEATCLQIPELDLGFDMGSCPRAMLPSKHLAITHGHMDHVGGLAYFCSQRRFQGMGTAKIICDERIAPAIRRMMEGYVDLERQRTPFDLLPLKPEQQIEIKNNMMLRGFETEHTCPSFGYSVVERRTKLKQEYTDLPQEKLRELKDRGVEITRSLEIPLVAFTGDTAPGPHLIRDDVRKAQIVIAECTFFEPDHKDRAKIGMHMHLDDIAEWLRVLECQHLVLVHVSRRTDMQYARKRLMQTVGEDLASRVHFLMDYRTNRARYEQQFAQAEAKEHAAGGATPTPEAPEAV